MAPRALLTVCGLLFAPAVASAQCAQPYTLDALLGDLGTIEGALRAGDDAGASSGADKMESGFACLNELMPVMIIGRAYRAVAAGKIAGGNVDRGMEWYRTATEMEQSFDYGLEDLPADHPVRQHYADAKLQASGEVVTMEDMAFIDGNHWVDGRKYDVPKARLDRPHVYQLEGGGQVMSWVITGNGYPPDVLRMESAVADADESSSEAVVVGKAPKQPKTKPAKEPKPGKEKPEEVAKSKPTKPPKAKTSAGSDGTTVVQRQRPPEKTPLIIGGTAIVAGAGGIYFAATRARAAFEAGSSIEEIEKLQAQTNQLVIASAATLGVGAGVLTWGVILDGGTPLPAVQFQF